MVEIHGWLVIRATYLDEDKHPEIDEDAVYSEVNRIVAEVKHNDIAIKVRNGLLVIDFLLHSNHKTIETDELLDTFTRIAQTATGSYGMLYYLNDDDLDKCNEFDVLVARKGQVEWKKDEFFSPISQMIEDNES